MRAAAGLLQILVKSDDTVALMRRLFRETFDRSMIPTYGLAAVCMITLAASTAASAGIIRYVVNDIFVSQDATKMWSLSLAIIAIFVIKGCADYGQSVALARIGNAITRTFQERLIAKITVLPIVYFFTRHSSDFIMRISRNANAAQEAVRLVTAGVGRDFLTVIALTGVMIAQDPLMAAITLSISPLVVFAVFHLIRRIKDLDTDEFGTLARVVKATQETIQGIRIVKSFALETTMQEHVSKAARGAEHRANAINAIQATTSPLMETLGGIAIALVILYAGWQTTANDKTPGEFMAFLTAFLLAYEPAKRLARLNVSLHRCLNRVRMLYELLDEPGTESDRADAKRIERATGRVVLRDVSFGYRKNKKVLHGINLEAEPGQVVALVGPSGAGKTTIINLIHRLMEPWSGEILIDDIEIRDIQIESVRRNVSFVAQDTFLFSGTVYENIACGNPEATHDEVLAAADAGLVTEFSDSLKKGLDTEVGENGVTLSGGQRQRIAIARAILKNAPILLLDEATSSLDNTSEALVRDAIARLMISRTTIVVAHRLSTIVDADRIFVIRDGRVVDAGRHEQLVAKDGPYAELFSTDRRSDALRAEWDLVS